MNDLGELEERLRDLASVPSRAAAEASENIAALIAEEFAGQHDAYGKAWAPHEESTVQRWGEHPIHDLTGDEMGGVNVKPMSGAGIAITFDTDYSAFHQTGTGNMVARPVLPDGDALPPSWQEAIGSACANAAARSLR